VALLCGLLALVGWIWGESHVSFATWDVGDSVSFGEEACNILLLDAGEHHAFVSLVPVHWCGDLFRDGQLQTVNHPKYLIEVSTSGSWVKDGGFHFLVSTNDENGTGRHWHSLGVFLNGVDHSEFSRELSAWVGHNWVWKVSFRSGDLLDVVEPVFVAFNIVARNGAHFDVTLCELRHDFGQVSKFGGANWREVIWVGTEQSP